LVEFVPMKRAVNDHRPAPRRAVALISGGLDSMLAARVVQAQGVHVEGLNFFTGFCVEGHTHAIRNTRQKTPRRNNALWVAEQLGMRLHIIDVIEEYKDVLLKPRHGYGANLNPCLDCKSFMVGKARQWLEQNGFDFIITGEVVGQRPMSQRRDTLPVVARESGAHDLLLRPLCARLQPPTLPEREGWVDRERLYDFNGRSRKPQMALAAEYGIEEYAQPAGGCCFLTDASYANKLRDLWQARGEKRYELDDIMLLKVGRHLRPRPHFKLIVARDAGETRYLQGYRGHFAHLEMTSHGGPLTLIEGEAAAGDFELAARIAARFGQGRNAHRVSFRAVMADGSERLLSVVPLLPNQVPRDWYV
jgi:tRNA U34 2-thiouridine synthase MnmA/TrmU